MTMSVFQFNLTIATELCNLRCKYCWLTSGDEFLQRQNDHVVVQKKGVGRVDSYAVGDVVIGVAKILEQCNASVLKISGGEVYLIPEVLEVIFAHASKFDKIQILTNGTLIDLHKIQQLNPDVFCFQVSLDGHTARANKLRFGRGDHLTKRVMDAIALLDSEQFNIEVNSVVTSCNIDQLPAFMRSMHARFPCVTVFPFPVRFRDGQFGVAADSGVFDHLLEMSHTLRGTVPPAAYIQELRQTIASNKQTPCLLPVLTLNSDEDGNLNLCPCGQIATRGNLFHRPVGSLALSLSDPVVQDVISWRHDKCKHCFTHFDVINLFMRDRITADEMALCGMFREQRVLNSLIRFKRHLLRGNTVARSSSASGTASDQQVPYSER
jgi:uncharacterized Fe-S cluster-containing radical SAM superfamily protein